MKTLIAGAAIYAAIRLPYTLATIINRIYDQHTKD